jgi:hypothetical protein
LLISKIQGCWRAASAEGLGIEGKELGNHVLGFVRNVRPTGVGEREFADFDFLHDFLITGSVEGRNT